MAMYKNQTVELPESENGLTLMEIIEHRKANKVPADARLLYQGCGSHRMAWEWKEALSTEAEHEERLRLRVTETTDSLTELRDSLARVIARDVVNGESDSIITLFTANRFSRVDAELERRASMGLHSKYPL